jgi:hypothetical protein
VAGHRNAAAVAVRNPATAGHGRSAAIVKAPTCAPPPVARKVTAGGSVRVDRIFQLEIRRRANKSFASLPLFGRLRSPCERAAIHPSVLLGAVPFFVNFFAMTMGVNHGEDENNQPGHQQNDKDGLILPDFTDEFGQIRGHGKVNHITSAKNWNDDSNHVRGGFSPALPL